MTKTIIAFILIAASVGLIFGYVRPTFNAAEVVKQDTAQYDQALSKAKEIQELKRSLLTQYNLFADGNLTKLRKLLPEHIDNVRLVFDLDGIATAHGIHVSGVKVQDTESARTDIQTSTGAVGFNSAAQAAQAYDTRIIEFSTVATYAQFKAFLEDLERSLRIVDLVSLKVSGAQQPKQGGGAAIDGSQQSTGGEYVYRFDVGIRTYWLK